MKVRQQPSYLIPKTLTPKTKANRQIHGKKARKQLERSEKINTQK